jgi:hypothetical protein
MLDEILGCCFPARVLSARGSGNVFGFGLISAAPVPGRGVAFGFGFASATSTGLLLFDFSSECQLYTQRGRFRAS